MVYEQSEDSSERYTRNKQLPVYQDSNIHPYTPFPTSCSSEGSIESGELTIDLFASRKSTGYETKKNSKSSRKKPPHLGNLANRTFRPESRATKLYLQRTARGGMHQGGRSIKVARNNLSEVHEEPWSFERSGKGSLADSRIITDRIGHGKRQVSKSACALIPPRPNSRLESPNRAGSRLPADLADVSVKLELPIPPKAPDGGFGWVVVIGSFIANFLVDGTCYTSGMFNSEFNQVFGEPKWKTAAIMALLTGYGFTGPIVAALANKYTCRCVTMTGSFMACFTFTIASFANNVTTLIFTFGMMGGISLGMMYLPSIVIVGFYFDKKRSLATGISVCGSSIGGFLFPPFYSWFVKIAGWRNTLRVVAGAMLLGCFAGYTYFPLEVINPPKHENNDKQKDDKCSQSIKGIDKERVKSPIKKESKLIADQEYVRRIKEQYGTNNNEPLPDSVDVYEYMKSHSMPILRHRNSMNDDSCKPLKRAFLSADAILITETLDIKEIMQMEDNVKKDLQRPVYRKDIFYGSSVLQLQKAEHNPENLENFILGLTEVPEPSPLKRKWYHTIVSTLSRLINLALLKDRIFQVYCFTSFLCLLGLFSPFIYLPMKMKSIGFTPTDSASILSIIGITNAFSRVVVGYISGFECMNTVLISGVAQTIAGVATIMLPFAKSYALLAIYGVTFGSTIAAWVALQSIIIVRLKGLDLLTNAFGLTCMFKGVASFIGPPLAGWLSDRTGSIDYVFYMAGTMITLGGLVMFTLWKTEDHSIPKVKKHAVACTGNSLQDSDLDKLNKDKTVCKRTDN